MQKVVLVVPCFNEELRFDTRQFVALAKSAEVHLLLVDDGSTDGTRRVLNETRARAPDRIEVLGLDQNGGKAEAVRQGVLRAFDFTPSAIGYIDADLATPVEEILRLVSERETRNAAVVLGARVALLGHDIDRRALRHYAGRVFATAASAILHLPVYDTQCGAKIFRANESLRRAMSRRFVSRWAFDVELLGRLLTGSEGGEPVPREDFYEVPLQRWADIPGSKIRATHLVKVGFDLITIARELYPRRVLSAPVPPKKR